jgi:ferredoxin
LRTAADYHCAAVRFFFREIIKGGVIEMRTQIYYFSGTGNSLHIAKELRKRLPGAELIPIIGAVNANEIQTKADKIGFVFPIHCLGIPMAVKNFLKNIKLESASYLFAVTSRICSSKVFSEIDGIISKQGKKLDSCFSVQMPQSYVPVFEVDNKDEIEKKEADMRKELDSIERIVNSGEKYRKPDPKEIGTYIYYLLRPIVIFIFGITKHFNLENRFYTDNNCSGCGTCSRVCLSDKIEMKKGRPAWNKNTKCLYCLACIHYCPSRAIQIKRGKTIVRGRYHHPKVSAEELSNQKSL